MPKANTKYRSIRPYLIGALGILLVWQVLTRSFAAYLASETPEAALLLQSNEPLAKVTLADRMLNPAPDDERSTDQTAEVKKDNEDNTPQGADRLAGWAEIALKAAAQKLPLDRGKGARAAQSVLIPSPLTDQERTEIRSLALASLTSEPLNSRALRILGQLADAAGDEPSAYKYMHASASRSLAENVATYWMMQKSFERKDFAGALYYADVLLRKHPQLIGQVIPVLAKMAESPDQNAVAALKQELGRNPPWRSTFFDNLPGKVTDARTPLNVLLSLKDASIPVPFADLNSYFSFLLVHNLYELAYYTWLQFLPTDELASIGYVANGDFERSPTGAPFDWVISQGPGVTVDIVPRPDTPDQRALYIELGPGRVDFPGVTQMTLLPPGNYRLSGKIRGELSGQRGLQWRVICVKTNIPPIGEGRMFVGMAPVWTDFEFSFTVPEKECRAQQLRLELAARSASEQLVSGSIWYDDLQIVRAPEVAKDAAVAPVTGKDSAAPPDAATGASATTDATKDAAAAPDSAKGAVASPDTAKQTAAPPDAAKAASAAPGAAKRSAAAPPTAKDAATAPKKIQEPKAAPAKDGAPDGRQQGTP